MLLLFFSFYCGAGERQILHMYTIKFIFNVERLKMHRMSVYVQEERARIGYVTEKRHEMMMLRSLGSGGWLLVLFAFSVPILQAFG